MNQNIKIDFYGSTHGHFLSFLSNVFIMQVQTDNYNVFNSVGAAHCMSDDFNKRKIINHGHYYINDTLIDPTDIVIRITLDQTNDSLFYMALVNLYFRAGDVGYENMLLSIPQSIREDPVLLRNNFYSKINERDEYIKEYNLFRPISNRIFEFPFECFYNFTMLCKKLNELAYFLDQTFFPDNNLYWLWKTFIEKNQGYHSLQLCNTIIQNIFSGESHEIPVLTALEEAFINYNITKITRLYTGTCFLDVYPTNTLDIYNQIKDHLESLK